MTDTFDIRNSAFGISPARRLAIMNLAIRAIEADIGKEHDDTFRHVQHPDLRADYVLANPPFNDSDWFRKDDDVRWHKGETNSNSKRSWR
jgi:type I restriction enzyme M protein